MKRRSGARALAMEPGGLAQQRDDLADFAERDPLVLGGAGVGDLASQAGQGGPVERPGLRDRLLLDVAGQLVEPIDQGLVDRTLGRSIRMIFDRGERGGSLVAP